MPATTNGVFARIIIAWASFVVTSTCNAHLKLIRSPLSCPCLLSITAARYFLAHVCLVSCAKSKNAHYGSLAIAPIRSKIKRDKGVNDAQKCKLYTKLAREISHALKGMYVWAA